MRFATKSNKCIKFTVLNFPAITQKHSSEKHCTTLLKNKHLLNDEEQTNQRGSDATHGVLFQPGCLQVISTSTFAKTENSFTQLLCLLFTKLMLLFYGDICHTSDTDALKHIR